ncbi:hypothetical protein [Rhodococcus globerulus]|uniref:hypothetical protein n=1 Tax=Rhodococcus globerulus TaxID=33008 RepID=UPI00068F84AE|nr:hypothetical protein [Rhodococcus globerulus]PVX59528.1 hypothetical protein C8E04_6095 [Rhodococcus globerulus]
MQSTPPLNREEADHVHDVDPGIIETDQWIGIGNEFAGVTVRKVWTRNGERLEVRIPLNGKHILLDPMQLEVIAEQKPQLFTDLIRIRLGSEDDERTEPQ